VSVSPFPLSHVCWVNRTMHSHVSGSINSGHPQTENKIQEYVVKLTRSLHVRDREEFSHQNFPITTALYDACVLLRTRSTLTLPFYYINKELITFGLQFLKPNPPSQAQTTSSKNSVGKFIFSSYCYIFGSFFSHTLKMQIHNGTRTYT
jgi:hypothetical protein